MSGWVEKGLIAAIAALAVAWVALAKVAVADAGYGAERAGERGQY